MSSKIWQFVEKVFENDAFCGIMHETAAEQKESRSPEVPADIVILFILMNMIAMARCKDEPFLLAAFLSGVQHTMEFQNFAAFA